MPKSVSGKVEVPKSVQAKTVKKRKVSFQPDNIEMMVEQGANLREVAIQAGIRLIASVAEPALAVPVR